MGTKERQEREKTKVRQAILDAARDLFVKQGFEDVSIRKIAERIEYSPAAIYSYFPSKDDIFFALAEEGFRLLCGDWFTQPEPWPADKDPLEQLRHIAWHFYEFNTRYPEHFALMFLDRTVPKLSARSEFFPMLVEMKRKFAGLIQVAMDRGDFPADSNPHAISRVLMTSMLGVCTARLCNRMGGRDQSDELARTMIEVVIAGMRSGVPVTFPATLMSEEECDPDNPCQQADAIIMRHETEGAGRGGRSK